MSSTAALAFSTDQPPTEVRPRPAQSSRSPRSTPHSETTTTLDRLPIGAHARVVGVAGDDPIAQRLADMGFWPGTPIHVVRQALLGDPVQYTLRGYRLALRRSEARLVQVSCIDSAQRSGAPSIDGGTG